MSCVPKAASPKTKFSVCPKPKPSKCNFCASSTILRKEKSGCIYCKPDFLCLKSTFYVAALRCRALIDAFLCLRSTSYVAVLRCRTLIDAFLEKAWQKLQSVFYGYSGFMTVCELTVQPCMAKIAELLHRLFGVCNGMQKNAVNILSAMYQKSHGKTSPN